ncbi:MAG: class I tRNA ligase family protein, partial [Clostridia bacterium]|nr:class I tRNA ligase family protein [Clostridia bacterium]
RYPNSKNHEEAFNREWTNKMLPVDKYVGGAEHAAMHLLYARFFTKALRDMGYLDFDEPFKSLVHQGTILGADGQKMSKSRGNTVLPDEYIQKYGSDVFRMYLAFGFAYIEGGPWSDDGIKAIDRFVGRVERIVEKVVSERGLESTDSMNSDEKELNLIRHSTIKSVTQDTEQFQFNTAIARLMELVNAIYKYDNLEKKNRKLLEETIFDLLKLLSPFAPHFAEEMWELTGHQSSIFRESWPSHDEKALVRDEVELAVQFNGQIRFKINVPSSADNKAIEEITLKDSRSAPFLEGKDVAKVIVVKGRLVNIVVK